MDGQRSLRVRPGKLRVPADLAHRMGRVFQRALSDSPGEQHRELILWLRSPRGVHLGSFLVRPHDGRRNSYTLDSHNGDHRYRGFQQLRRGLSSRVARHRVKLLVADEGVCYIRTAACSLVHHDDSKSKDTSPGRGRNEQVLEPDSYCDLSEIPKWRQVLSNFSDDCPVVHEGLTYRTVEHAFQAAKIRLKDPDAAYTFALESRSPLSNASGADAQKQRRLRRLTRSREASVGGGATAAAQGGLVVQGGPQPSVPGGPSGDQRRPVVARPEPQASGQVEGPGGHPCHPTVVQRGPGRRLVAPVDVLDWRRSHFGPPRKLIDG